MRQNTIVTKDPVQSNELTYVRCVAHIVNLIVQEGLKEVDETILKVLDVVRHGGVSLRDLTC